MDIHFPHAFQVNFVEAVFGEVDRDDICYNKYDYEPDEESLEAQKEYAIREARLVVGSVWFVYL